MSVGPQVILAPDCPEVTKSEQQRKTPGESALVTSSRKTGAVVLFHGPASADDLAFSAVLGRNNVSNVMGHAAIDAGRTHIASSSMGHDILLTNPGLITLQLANRRFRVTELWGPSVLIGFQGEQSVSALTFNERLFLTHISTSPIASHLKDAESRLLAETKKRSSDEFHQSQGAA